jgi:hypothetical protein
MASNGFPQPAAQASMRVPSTFRNLAIQSGWAGLVHRDAHVLAARFGVELKSQLVLFTGFGSRRIVPVPFSEFSSVSSIAFSE